MGCLLMQIVIFGLLFSILTFSVAAKGGPDRCGTVAIPYPFGIGDGCSLNKHFNVRCDNSTNPPKVYLSRFEVIELSIDGRLTILHFKAEDCPQDHENSIKDLYWATNFTTLTDTSPMFFLSSKNKFIVIGCSAQGLVMGYTFGANHGYSIGCKSLCDKYDAMDKKSCSGNGCCEIDLPEKLYEIDYSAIWMDTEYHSQFFQPWPCTSAFIVDGDKFNYSLMFNKSIPLELPIAMDWSVNDDQWLQKRRNSSIKICKKNSMSYKPDNVPGLRCKCKEGYEGNPYLGCQDIDECKDEGLNKCMQGCKNEIGSYKCFCPKWYKGDGKINSQGCAFHLSTIIIVIITIFCVILVIPSLVVIVWWLFKLVKKRREDLLKKDFFKRNGGLLLKQMTFGDENEMPTRLFISRELERATDNYNENRILGQGTVYKGMLEDGKLVAIKKSKLVSESQLGQFINEMVVLHEINHRNIVKLLGCCLETKVPMLVYEYIPNRMLSQHLHDQNEELSLAWNMRLQIAVEVADALYYLHSAASNPIYHCDIKSSNILVDEKYTAKVADFGIARSIDIDQTHITTPNIQGTLGYLDPEYFRTGQFIAKSDVYSFGVVLIELLTRQKPISSSRGVNEGSLVDKFFLIMEEFRLFEMVDSRVVKEGSNEAIVAFADLAKRCLNIIGKDRPTMKEVAIELHGIKKSQDLMNMQDEREVEIDDNGIPKFWEVGSTSTMSYGNMDIENFPTLPRM